MPEKNVFPLTMSLTAAKLRASRFSVALAALLPAFLAFVAARGSCGTAMKFFLFFFPYVFLVAAQDMAGTEISSGALENVIFLRGVFRRFLWRKNFALAASAGAYAAAVFIGLALWSLARGRFDPNWGLQFGLGLLAGFYYIGAAGALSHFLKGGSNVVVILLAQAASLLGLLASAASRSAFIDHLEAGKFPDLVSRLKFLGFTAVFPNLIVSPRLRAGALVAAVGLAAALALQRALLRRLELRKEGRA